jgi:2-keto-4-pentenoate hydratase
VRSLFSADAGVDIGYEIQERNTAIDLAGGRRVSGRKIRLTSKAVQSQPGVDQPDFGTLFVDMEYSDGAELPYSRLVAPRAEAEVAFVMERDLNSAPHGFAEVIRAVAFALPAIEVADSRIQAWDITLLDTVADNASCGLYVLGGRPVALGDVDLREAKMSMSLDGLVVSTGSGSDCLGHPLAALRWLADALCDRGIPLRAGDVIMSGALGAMVSAGRGSELVATISGLGSVHARLE